MKAKRRPEGGFLYLAADYEVYEAETPAIGLMCTAGPPPHVDPMVRLRRRGGNYVGDVACSAHLAPTIDPGPPTDLGERC